MRRRIWSAAAACTLAAALTVPGAVNSLAAGEPPHWGSGDGYRAESYVKDPDPIPYGDLGSMRGVAQNNTLSDEFRAGLYKFSYQTASAVLKDGRGNRNYSPVSLYNALALAALGAGGNTGNQLLALLQAPDQNTGKLSEGCGNLYRMMYRNNENSQLRLANSLWLQDGAALADSWRRTAESQYYTAVFRVNLTDEKTPGIMGRWIGEQTGQKMNPAFPALGNTGMRSVGAVSFYDQWTYGFEKKQNVSAPFYQAEGREITCEYMTDERNSSYFRGQGYWRASLTTKNNATMIFVLPDEGVTVSQLLSSEATVAEMFGQAAESYGKVSWKIPKFQFQTSLSLRPALESLGVTGAFDPQQAEFTGLTGERLFMGDVLQETRIGISEYGVETSEYTEIPKIGAMYSETAPADMNLNRPFLYAVIVTPGVPLYIGVCEQPGI